MSSCVRGNIYEIFKLQDNNFIKFREVIIEYNKMAAMPCLQK
jgi:hypothetical protein